MEFRLVALNSVEPYLRWWKSCPSGDGRKGRWYPQWPIVVLKMATLYHRMATERWDPMTNGPARIGMRFTNTCSRGWQYTETMPTGAVHSWCVLWMCL